MTYLLLTLLKKIDLEMLPHLKTIKYFYIGNLARWSPVHELVPVSAGILLRILILDLLIGQTVQISSINLVQSLPSEIRSLNKNNDGIF